MHEWEGTARIRCIISDVVLYFTLSVASQLKLPRLGLRTGSLTSFLAFAEFLLNRRSPIDQGELRSRSLLCGSLLFWWIVTSLLNFLIGWSSFNVELGAFTLFMVICSRSNLTRICSFKKSLFIKIRGLIRGIL